MEKRFRTGKENHTIADIIDSELNEIELIGWSSDDEVVIENWSFINFKREPKDVYKKDTSKWVHLNKITFKNCVFKDVNFIGGVPMDGCTFKNCSFENCLLADHIRWNEFNNCRFTFCIFAGYFHGSKFNKSCKFDKVLMEYYTDRAVSGLKHVTSCTEKERIEILKYFYSEEAKVFDTYKKGDVYFVKKFENSFLSFDDKLEYVTIDGKEYFKDKVKEIKFDLTHYEPSIRIVGRYAPLVKECKSVE